MGLRLKRIALFTVALLVLAQFFPVQRVNPATDPAKTVFTADVPANVRQVLEGSCLDCHSNQTSWPWYSQVAPLSWVIAHDVNHGRHALNFSEWATYPPQKKELKLGEICDQVSNGDMPDTKYVLLHRKAALSKEQRDALCQWADSAARNR